MPPMRAPLLGAEKEVVMALEQVFSCPRTLAKLRANPLGRILEGFCLWLLEEKGTLPFSRIWD